MIDEDKVRKFSSKGAPGGSLPGGFNWKSYPVETLIRLKTEIEACLPPTKLKDVDVEAELVSQLRIAQALQARVLDAAADEAPLNQVVQAVNSTATIIEKLSKLQIDLAASENLKRMEMALVKALESLPDSAKETFFSHYEKVARHEGVNI